MKKLIFLTGLAAFAASAPANAQFGGMPKLPGADKGDSAASSVSADDVDKFLAKSFKATKYIWLSVQILNKAAEGRGALGAAKQELTAISNFQNTKELNAKSDSLKSSIEAISANKQLVEQLNANYQNASAEEKALIRAAIYNFAVFLPQLIKMPQNIADLAKGISGNPRLLGKVSELKTAGSLIGIQLKGTATVITVLPKLMSIAKVKAPSNPETSKEEPMDFSSQG